MPDRPHLRLAPPLEVDLKAGTTRQLLDGGDPFCLWCSRVGLPSPHGHESDEHPDGDPAAVPHFDLPGFAAALKVGGLASGMRIRLSGVADPAHNGLYDVGVVTPTQDGGCTAQVSPVGRPGEAATLTADT